MYVEKSTVAPILLFNEADALIGKRLGNTEYAVDKMENTIQNILLQEMENLNGIMIATTNFTQSLDRAFERRFLFKIEFDKPCTEAKSAIWKAMIPELSDEDVRVLSENYNFSGGQIENIARKRTIENIINGENVSFDCIRAFCDSELISNDRHKKVGFL